MKPLLYEIRRALTGKAIVVISALLIILPILMAVTSASGSGGGGGFNIDGVGYGYGGNGTYNVSVFLYNSQYGTPIQGTPVKIFTGTTNISEKTDSGGFVNETLHNITRSESENLTFQYSFTAYGTTNNATEEIQMGEGQSNPYFTSTTYQQIVNNSVVNQTIYYPRVSLSLFSVPNNPRLNDLGLQYDLSGLSNFPSIYIYYKSLSNSTATNNGGRMVTFSSQMLMYSNISAGNRTLSMRPSNSTYLSNESQLRYFGESPGLPVVPVNTANLTANKNSTRYLFEVFSPNGTELAYAVVQLTNRYSGTQVSSIFNSDELPLLGVFVPLMAVLSGFTTFGRDKVEGSLKYVIVRPLSRRALIGSRFFSNVLAIFIPAVASVGVSSALFHYYLGTYIPPETIYLSLWAVAIMSAGFTGLVYLASSMMKSLGRLVGTSIGIFLLFDLFWSFPGFPIIPSLASYSIPMGSLKYAVINVAMDYATPSGFVNLVSYIGYRSTSQPIFLGNFLPSQVGITLVAVIGIGIAWIVIPFVLSMIRFSKFD